MNDTLPPRDGESAGDQANGLRSLRDKREAKPLRTIAVCSGKGGVGKTCVAVNLACLAAKQGERVLLLDADLGLANVEILLGIRPRYHMGDLLEGRSIHEVMAPGPHGIRILAGGSGLADITHLDDEDKRKLMLALEPLEDTFDTVIIDAGAGIGENVLFFVGAAQERLLVVNPEPTALTDAYATVKVLSESGVGEMHVLVNSASSELEARNVFRTLAGVCDKHLSARIQYLGAIPKDGAVPQAVMSQKPVVDLFPRSAAAAALAQISQRFSALPQRDSVDGGLKFLYGRLMREHAA